MSRIVNAAALAGLAALMSAAAGAQGLGDTAAALGQNTANPPKWLSSTSESGLYLGPDGFSQGTRSESSVKLGDGLTVGVFSSLSTAPAGGAINGLGGGSLMDPLGRWGALNTGLNGLSPVAGSPSASTFGGRLTKDLGGGLSVNFAGGVTRDPTGGYYLGPRGSLNMNPGGEVSTSVGGGMSMDLGGGSSFSVSGTMSRSSANGFSMGRCNGLTTGFCR
ncbi:MAG: hypothetical protein ACYCZX_15100 [Rhodospirillaceae bacterium]